MQKVAKTIEFEPAKETNKIFNIKEWFASIKTRWIDKTQPFVEIVKRLEKDFEENDIYSTSNLEDIVDEAPECYKETDLIKELIEPSVEILEQLKPVLNVKG